MKENRLRLFLYSVHFIVFYLAVWTKWFYLSIFSSFVLIVPLLVLYYLFDFPLFLRNYLWFPFIAYLIVFKTVHLPLFFLH